MKKIIFAEKLINSFKKTRDAILNNGFSRYIVDTIAPTFRFLSFILKNNKAFDRIANLLCLIIRKTIT